MLPMSSIEDNIRKHTPIKQPNLAAICCHIRSQRLSKMVGSYQQGCLWPCDTPTNLLKVANPSTARIIKAPPNDPRRVVGARVHARASLVTSLVEFSRLFGSLARTKFVAGTVREVLPERPNNRQLTKLDVEWFLPTGSKLKTLPIASCKAGDPLDVEMAPSSKVGGEPQVGDEPRIEQYSCGGHVTSAAYSQPVAPAQGTQQPVATVHGIECFEEDVRIPIGVLSTGVC
jgi:hypothetical protein